MRSVFNILVTAYFAFAIGVCSAQNFPVRVTPILAPPYTPFLTDYIDPSSDKLTLQIVLNDITIPEYRCKLRLTIEGVNISITTNPNYAPLPLVLSGGVPEILYGSDIAEYFKNSNLIFKGITQQEFEKKGNQLPEGIYRFSFEVLDYNRGTVVSNKGNATAWMLLNDPPFINLPASNAKLKPLHPQNIVFQWTPRHRGSPNAAFTTEYDVKLVEIWPKGRNPYDAINTSLPIFETTVDNTMVVYGPAETPLVPGREYAMQVRARDTMGKDLFKNNGYSEVVRFVYGDECPMPSGILTDDIGTSKARVRWQGNGQNSGYVLRYREKKDGAEWFEENTEQTYFNATGIRSGATYEYQLCGECEAFRSEFTKELTFSTLAENPNAFVCGNPNALVPIDGSGPLPVLMSNDFIKAGGFDVVVTHAIGSNGKFSGDGLAIVPWFNSAKVRVTFENITVNKSYQLTSGFINSIWNKDSKLLLTDENKLTENGTPSSQFKSDVQTFEADTTVLIKGTMIASVFSDSEGNVVVQTTDGGSVTLEKGKSYAIADEVGNGYLVDKEGKVTKTTATDAIAAGQKGSREYSGDPNINIRFAKSIDTDPKTKYGFDEKREGTLPQHYQQTENEKWVAWKALSTGQSDVVQVIAEGSTDLGKIKFQLEGVSPQVLTPSGQTLTLTGKANGTIEELLAYVPQQDTSKNDLVAGKLNVVSYESTVSKKLVLIAVNGTTAGFSVSTLQSDLNKIYSQAMVAWDVESTIQTLKVDGISASALDDGGSGLLSNYTPEMKQVLNAYLNGNQLADNSYYLFLLNNAKSGSKLGYMPRSKQAGFIFLAPHKTEAEIIHTIAHELGHGAFHLKHTFSEEEFIAAQSTTDNLMDYAGGKALDKYQWDYIHNPENVIGLFEGDEEGALAGMTEEQVADWWEKLPPYKKAAEILQEHLEGSEVYENVRLTCDNSKCIITADLKISADITYTMEVTLLSTMTADELITMLMFEYRVDLWDAFNVKAEDMWDELYHWWRKQNDDLAQQKGWQVSTLNFLADVITAPTLYPAVSGWATGKHWRDGHDLAGWEQALAALDFLVAEEMVKGCITNFVVRVGGKTVNLLRLKEGTKYLVQKSIENGLKFSVLANDEVTILTKEGRVVGKIVDDILTIPYSKYGGEIVCQINKTTTVIGKYIDLVDGDGIKIIKENKLYKYGENIGGVNILDDANWSWPINENWLREAVQRGDVIRVISDPRDIRNLYKVKDGNFIDAFDNVIKESEVLSKGVLTPFAKEIQLLENQLKKKFNSNLFVYE